MFKIFKQPQQLKTELLAGVTSFFAISYIIIVNPLILKDAGMPVNLSVFATIIISAIGCLIMAFWADAPVILTPGMGVNAFFTYTLVVNLKFSWREALAVSILSSLAYLVIAFTPLVHLLAKTIPASLKTGISVGIGLFLVELGLKKAGLIVAGHNGSLVAGGNLASPMTLLALFGLVLTLVLYLKKVPGYFIIGIITSSILAVIFHLQAAAPPVKLSQLTQMSQLINQANFSQIGNLKFWLAVFSLTMILVFESMGLLTGILPDQKKFPRAFQSSSMTAVLSGVLGSSPTVAAAESAAGIESGGRSGIVALVAAILFSASLFVVGGLKYIPQAAIAPALILTGAMMMQQLQTLNLQDFSEWFPAFLIITLIPLTGSIATGLAFGFVSYPVVKWATKQGQQLNATLLVLSGLFLLDLIVNAIL